MNKKDVYKIIKFTCNQLGIKSDGKGYVQESTEIYRQNTSDGEKNGIL